MEKQHIMKYLPITFLFLIWSCVEIPEPKEGPGKLEVTPLDIDFGQAELYQSKFDTVKTQNIGYENLTISQLRFDGINKEDFSVSETFLDPLRPGEYKLVSVGFSPSLGDELQRVAELIVESDENNATVQLTGELIESTVDYVVIPDDNFRYLLLTQTPVDRDGDGIITREEALTINEIYGYLTPPRQIDDLTGLREFKNLESFSLSLNTLSENCKTVDLRGLSKLVYFDVSDNYM